MNIMPEPVPSCATDRSSGWVKRVDKVTTNNVPQRVILITAQRMHRLSLQRGYYFYTNLFKNPPWLIMLTLFVGSLTDIPVNAPSVKLANRLSGDEYQTAIDQLMDAGMIEFYDDELIRLTPPALTQMDGFIREILSSRDQQA